MGGSGESKNYLNDEEIANLLISGKSDKVMLAIKLIHQRYGKYVFRLLREMNPGLPAQSITDIYEQGLADLALYCVNGRFKEQENKIGALALLIQMVRCDCTDLYRKLQRHKKLQEPYLIYFERTRYDNPQKLSKILLAINEFIDSRLEELERDALKTYVLLLNKNDEVDTDQSLMDLLPREVNRIAGRPKRSAAEVISAFKSGRRKLRNYLIREGIVHEPRPKKKKD